MSSSTLQVIVVDVSPLAWGERDLTRDAQDKARAAVGKRSVGPCVLPELLQSLQALCVAFYSIEQNASVVILAVADNESAIVYPRKDQLEQFGQEYNSAVDITTLQTDLITGVNEVVHAAANKASLNGDPMNRQASMAAAFSKALCWINRCLVVSEQSGIAALQTQSAILDRNDDDDDDDNAIVALSSRTKKRKKSVKSGWSPRILLVQASEDRSKDYNAFMNCAFCSSKQNIVVDGCFLATSTKQSSSFLEQAVDLTGGVFLAPSGAAQVGGALTEVLLAVFCAPLSCRANLQLPALHKVDFRARCFDTGETVDQAFVCNQCLSIFKNEPTATKCPTCQANIATT